MNINTLTKINYGMYVICSKLGDKYNGQIATTIMQVTSEPPKVIVCLNKETLTHEYVSKSRVFTASVLEQSTEMHFIGHFGFRSGREHDKFHNMEFKVGITGAPYIIPNCLAYIECKVINSFDVGTHTIFLGELVEAQDIKDGISMTYSYYHEVKRGKSPKAAPTYVGPVENIKK